MAIDKFYKHPSSPHQACSIEAEFWHGKWTFQALTLSLDCNLSKNQSRNQQQVICALLTNPATLQAATLVAQAARLRPKFTSQTH